MALFAPIWLLGVPLSILITFVGFYVNFLLRSSKYWSKQNVPHEAPQFLVGNMQETIYKRTFRQVVDGLYSKFCDKKFFGMWIYSRPCLVVKDIGLLKRITIKDFNYFQDRGLHVDEKLEPLAGHLFNLTGQAWRNLRVKLSPTFTSGKMKMMYNTMYEVGEQLQKILENPASKGATIEMKDLLACFATDVISSCAFGIETNSMENPDNDFRKYGKIAFDRPRESMITGILQFAAPWLSKLVPLRSIPKSAHDFFLNTVKEVMEEREKNNVQRKDFMQLLIELKNKGFIEDADTKQDHNSEAHAGDPFTVERAAAQAFAFLVAGFEQSSLSILLNLYELACKPDLQRRLQAEIDEYKENSGGKVTYQDIMEMKFLNQVVEEGFRKYPPVPMLFRECMKDYKIPGEEYFIKKGEFIVVPVSGIQNDPKHFEDPDRFGPERHTTEAKASRDSFLNLTFGAGPRFCIGSRFGILQTKLGMVVILEKFNVEMTKETPTPIVFSPRVFFPTPISGMPFKITKRK